MTLNGRNAFSRFTFYGGHQKKLNEDKHILSAAKCRSMILVSRNIRYMRIFAGVPRRGGVKRQWSCHSSVTVTLVLSCTVSPTLIPP